MKPSATATYAIVYVLLMVLLLLTVGVAFVHLGPLNLTAALVIAAVKATIVGLWFMHLKGEIALIRLIAAGGLLWLAIMLALSLSDYMTRGWQY